MEWIRAHKGWTAVIILVAGLAVLGALTDTPEEAPSSTDTARKSATKRPDPTTQPASGGRAACEHFHNVAVDWNDGQLTTSEVREKMREVAESAFGVNRVVEQNAREIVRLMTAGDDGNSAQAQRAIRAISEECDRVLGR